MRIVFIVGGFAPGRDGVGDYTRLLALECLRQGQNCAVLALHDYYVGTVTEEAAPFPTLRLPASLSWKERAARARDFLRSFQPDWSSLQFTPYAFHPRGLVFPLVRHLPALIADGRVQIMFHEPWASRASGAKTTDHWMGKVQRYFIRRLLAKLQPAVVQTSNPLYQAILGSGGIGAELLPLFGNIPVLRPLATDSLLPLIAQKSGLPVTVENRDHFWLVGFFGTIYRGWPPDPVLTMIAEAARDRGVRLCFVTIGQAREGYGVLEEAAARREIPLVQLGWLAEEALSGVLGALDFGITTTTASRAGRSGTVAAMLEHGLPVLANPDEWSHAEGPAPLWPAHFHLVDETLPAKLRAGLQHGPAGSTAPRVAEQLLTRLRSSET